MKKKNYAAIDVAKYVSALLVVCIHTYPLYDLSPAANTFLIQAICRFAVPFFFVVSAFLFFSKIDPAAGMRDALNLGMLKHYLRRLALLYGAWSVIYLPYTFLLWRGDGFSLTFLLRWIFDCFFNGSYYHLWFLPALMLGTLIVYVLYTNVSLRRGMLVTAILSGVIRDHTPAGKAGHFQGIRMIFGVLLPMILGPAIGAAVIRGSDSTYVDLGVVKTVPTPSIFLAAAVVLLLILPPVLALRKKEDAAC